VSVACLSPWAQENRIKEEKGRMKNVAIAFNSLACMQEAFFPFFILHVAKFDVFKEWIGERKGRPFYV
jgi:hypothetical protein